MGSEQIKTTTDNIGAFDGGNPDIRYSIDDSTEITEQEEQAEAEQGNIHSTVNQKALRK